MTRYTEIFVDTHSVFELSSIISKSVIFIIITMGQRVISKNTLFYGDNLTILRDYLADETIDLIYLDPPFNSSRNYNVLYKDESGADAEAQIVAFEDTWHWSQGTEAQYRQLSAVGDELARLLDTLVTVVGRNQMTAYLVMMAARLVELHRVLKPTGSLYLHCDPTASHYLKMILDMILGVGNFQNEIIWKRTSSHNRAKRWGPVHDVILYYSKSDKPRWNRVLQSLDDGYVKSFYKYSDDQGEYRLSDLTGPGIRTGDSGKPWKEIDPTLKERHWEPPPDRALPSWFAFPENYVLMTVQERLDVLDAQGLIYFPKKAGGIPSFKRYLSDNSGATIQDVIVDISPIGAQAKERTGYPTQKPLALLERIIQASSNPGEVVLDPFCGCGTTVHAAQKLKRTWVGIDITPLATALIKSRLYDAFKIEAKTNYDLIGEPTTLSDAQHLAKQDRYQFQWWALGLLPARPYGGQADSKRGKKGADKGIDGIITFQDSKDGADKRIIVQVKSGKVSSRDLRDLHGTIEREKNAVMGVFITLEPPSKNMEIEQMEIGYYHSAEFNRDYPKIQLFTIEQLLAGAKIKFPGTDTTLKRAQPEQPELVEQSPLL